MAWVKDSRLIECPWCKTKSARIIDRRDYEEQHIRLAVGCEKCGYIRADISGEKSMADEEAKRHVIDQLVGIWNTREEGDA